MEVNQPIDSDDVVNVIARKIFMEITSELVAINSVILTFIFWGFTH